MRPPPPPSYDPRAVAFVETIERILQQLRPERQGDFIAILNAIEYHVEEGLGVPVVLGHLADALMAMADVAHLDAHAVVSISKQLDMLRERVLAKAARSGFSEHSR